MHSRWVLVALFASSLHAQAEDDVCTGLKASESCPSSVLIQRNQLFQSSQGKITNPAEDFGFPLWFSDSAASGEDKEKKSHSIFSEDAPAEAPKKEQQKIDAFDKHAPKSKKADDSKESKAQRQKDSIFAFMKDEPASLLDLAAQPRAQPSSQQAVKPGNPTEQLPNPEDNKDLNEAGLKKVAKTKNEDEVFSFLHRLTEAMGLEPKSTKGDDFLYSLAKEYAEEGKADSFDVLVGKLLKCPDLKPTIIVKNGSVAPLSQNGYRGVVQQHDDKQMGKYMQRLAESMDLKVKNKGGLAGSAQWYSGKKAVQTLDKMRAELTAEARKKDGWVAPDDPPKKDVKLLAVMSHSKTQNQSGGEASPSNAPVQEHVITTKASDAILTSEQQGNASKANESVKVQAAVTNTSSASGTTLKKETSNTSEASGWKFNTTQRAGANANATDVNATTEELPDTAKEIAESLHSKSENSTTQASGNKNATSAETATSGTSEKTKITSTTVKKNSTSGGNVTVVAKVTTTTNETVDEAPSKTNKTETIKQTDATTAKANKTATTDTSTADANKTTLSSNATDDSKTDSAPKEAGNSTVAAKVTTAAAKTNTTATNSSATVNATVVAKTAPSSDAKTSTTSVNSSNVIKNSTIVKAGDAEGAKETTPAAQTSATSQSASKEKTTVTGAGTTNQTTTIKSNKTITNTTTVTKTNSTSDSANTTSGNVTSAGKVTSVSNSSNVAKGSSASANASGTKTEASKSETNTGKRAENVVGKVEVPDSLSKVSATSQSVPKEHKQFEFKSLSQGVYKRVAKNNDKEEMYSFVNQTMTAVGLEEEKEGFLEKLADDKSKADNFSELVDLLLNSKGAGLESTCVQKNGSIAPLSENGYRCVVQMQDENQMVEYTRRVANEMGLDLNTDGGVQGVVPFYNGKMAVQSLDKLREELRRQATSPDGWAKRRGANFMNSTGQTNGSNESTFVSSVVDNMEVGTPPPLVSS
mmetsp:Transcript_85077/g.155048  ORF Transcript_85077/g.155048 Transcript_85077/m.155048 type:complete len:983 (-) Transcript_85077:121-3069(-)